MGYRSREIGKKGIKTDSSVEEKKGRQPTGKSERDGEINTH